MKKRNIKRKQKEIVVTKIIEQTDKVRVLINMKKMKHPKLHLLDYWNFTSLTNKLLTIWHQH